MTKLLEIFYQSDFIICIREVMLNPRNTSYRIWFLFFLVIALIFLLSMDSTTGAFSTSSTTVTGERFAILIDAGSSGSRIHVFPYELEGPGHLPALRESMQLKITPGMSSFEKNTQDAGESLKKLLSFAKGVVPQEQWSITPVHLQATAGLRTIDSDAAEEILVSCRKTIHDFPFLFEDSWAKIITGIEEGIFGWLATNYLRGSFADDSIHTVGVIEMGGASMQMTFKPHDRKIIPVLMDGVDDPLEIVLLSINNNHFTVYTHSYLGYGLASAQKLFQADNIDAIEDVGNPCYPKHYKHSSTGSYSGCVDLVKNVFEFSNEKCDFPDQSCGFNSVYQPHITTEQFVAIENFFYTTSFYGISNQPEFVEHLSTTGSDFCETNWQELVQKYPDESASDLSKYCFSSAYIPTVLLEAFGFSKVQLHQSIEIARSINGVPIDWAIGSVLTSIIGIKMTTTAHKPVSSAFHKTPVEDINESNIFLPHWFGRSIFSYILTVVMLYGLFYLIHSQVLRRLKPHFVSDTSNDNNGPIRV